MKETAEAGARAVLVLLTNVYPFPPGEEFIEPEVPYLAEAFDRVVLVPTQAHLRASGARELPSNFSLVVPSDVIDSGGRNYSRALRFCARRPGDALRGILEALRKLSEPAHALQDLGLELFARMSADNVLERVAAEIRPQDRVVFYGYWMQGPARIAVQLRARLGLDHAPIVCRAHRYDLYSETHPSNYLPQRELLFDEIESVYSVSRDGCDYLRNKFPKYAHKIETRRLGVSAALSAGNPAQKGMLAYSCAHVSPVKRVPLLIEGLAAAQARGVNVEWAHIGSNSDPAVMAELAELAESKLAPGSFELLGNLTNAEIRERYATHPGMVFVNTSESEGVPVSIMEALAQGLPIIATNVGGSSELIAQELGMFDGLMTGDPSPEEIADRIQEIAEVPPEEYAGFVEGSLRTWRQRWSSEANFGEFSRELRRRAR